VPVPRIAQVAQILSRPPEEHGARRYSALCRSFFPGKMPFENGKGDFHGHIPTASAKANTYICPFGK
jgi:hypothetical protein